MASPSWFNENENRAYPFLLTSVALPTNRLIVDCGFVTSAKARFENAQHTVVLSAVRRQGSFFYLDFTSDAPELYGIPLTFSRHVADADFSTEFVDSLTAGLSASSESGSTSVSPSCNEPLWSGFLVTGRIEEFSTLLPTDGELSYTATVEPGLLQNLAETYVSKFGVVNADRTRVTAASDCEGETAFAELIRVNSACVLGDVIFKPGFNANVRQSTQDNSITLGAAVGDGAGEPCETVATYAGETAPSGSSLLEGGPRCNETVRSLNGIGGPSLNLIAGRGVTITAVPEENKIIVNVNMSGLALCYDSVSARSESC